MDQLEELDDLFGEFGVNYDDDQQEPKQTAVHEEDDEDWGIFDDQEYSNGGIESRVEDFVHESCIITSDEDSDAEAYDGLNRNVDCRCKVKCLEKYSNELIEQHKMSLMEMEKNEKEMFIIGCLQKIGNESTRCGKRKRIRYRFVFNGHSVCKSTFAYINDIGMKVLRNIQEHVNTNGPVPRIHGNTGKKPSHALHYEEVKYSVDWLIWFSDIHGLPMPAAQRGHDGDPPVLLPSSLTKKDVHVKYADACSMQPHVRKLGLSSFKNVWRHCVPHIKIMTPKDDVCYKCELLRKSVIDARTEGEKLTASRDLTQHIQDARTERQVYHQSIKEARDEMKTHVRVEGSVVPLSSNLRKVHYTFDYSQNVTIPHHSSQMGPLYFVSGRKIHMFGVRIDSTDEQYNYLIDEDQTIGIDGSGTHGPNSVISMLHDCLLRHSFGERECYFHADNCGSQNKNKYVYMMAYLSWRIHQGLHEDITLLMAIPGHTKCLVDGGFGRVKKLFKRSDCDSLEQFADIVNRSAVNNIPVQFRNGHEEQNWIWYDWKSFLSKYFLPLKGIQKYHCFRFKASDKTAVFVREHSDGPEFRKNLVKQNIHILLYTYPNHLQPAGLSSERQNYLYKKVRQYVRPAFQDITCPKLSEE